MKTLREILLEAHSDAEPKLDAIRSEVVAELGKGAARAEQRGFSIFREFCRSVRWHLTGLAGAWLLVFLLNSGADTEPRSAVTMVERVSVHEILQAMRQNQREISELIRPGTEPAELPPPSFVPRQRSERSRVLANC
jgi:hypothetical protein